MMQRLPLQIAKLLIEGGKNPEKVEVLFYLYDV